MVGQTGEAMSLTVMKYRLNENGMVDAPSIDVTSVRGRLNGDAAETANTARPVFAEIELISLRY